MFRKPGPPRSQPTNITSMPESADEERHGRVVRYAITMGVRTACLVLLIWVRGPLMWLCVAGAVFLPYIAVIFANAARLPRRPRIERPDDREIAPPQHREGSR